jgi:hypothetical protein
MKKTLSVDDAHSRLNKHQIDGWTEPFATASELAIMVGSTGHHKKLRAHSQKISAGFSAYFHSEHFVSALVI